MRFELIVAQPFIAGRLAEDLWVACGCFALQVFP